MLVKKQQTYFVQMIVVEILKNTNTKQTNFFKYSQNLINRKWQYKFITYINLCKKLK